MKTIYGLSYFPLNKGLGDDMLSVRRYSAAKPRSEVGDSAYCTPVPKRQVEPLGSANEP